MSDQDRERMKTLADQIRRSMETKPDAFDEREPLWMEHEDLRAANQGAAAA